MLRPICRFTAGGRLHIAAAHTHLSPAAPAFRRRGVMGSDDEGPLQAFKKGDDHKVQPNSWMHMLPMSSCPMWGILITRLMLQHAPSWHRLPLDARFL